MILFEKTFKIMLMIILVFSTTVIKAQFTQLSGVKICLDPGHGGHDSDDRPTDLGVGTIYYESDANWEAVGYLDTLLQKLGASVKITKITNDPDSPDRQPSLADRVQIANSFGADYFQSFHTNGSSSPTANYTLVLYAGPVDGTADYPDALVMAEIMDDQLFHYMRTTTHYARADIPFTGYTYGLGVLNGLNMPGTLSECSFHSNLNEGRRLMNSSYRKAAAWGILKSFLEYYNQSPLSVGEMGGVITDTNGNALNGIVVTINPGAANEQIYNGDQFLNGFYFFDWLSPGDYEVKFEKFGYDPQIKNVTITSGTYTEVDAALIEVGGAPSVPVLTSVSNPDGGTGINATWEQNPEITLLGYRLYYATDDSKGNWVLAANETSLTASATSISIASSDDFIVPPDEDVFHFKLTAVAESGAESGAGDIYSRSSNVTGDKIVIVDGFDRRGSYTEPYHDFATDYFTAIRDSRLAEVATASNEAIMLGTVNLSDYQMIVWFVGDESTADETFSDTEQLMLIEYLENGGKLLVSGSEIGWDLDNNGTASDQVFYHDYLKTSYVGDGESNYSPATGIANSGFDGLVIEFGISYPEDYPDDIAPVGGAEAILDYAVSGKIGGIAYKGVFGSGTIEGGIVNIAFPLETAGVSDQHFTIKKAMEYLEVGSYFPIPPEQPILQMVSGLGDGVAARWATSSESSLIGYRFYYATNNDLTIWELVEDEQVLVQNTSGLSLDQSSYFKVPPTGEIFHFRLTAISEGGFESEPSDVYSRNISGSKIQTLIVDGFDRYGGSGSYSESQHAFATNYFNGLLSSGEINVTTIANEKLADDTIDLKDYGMVFWFLGDESSGSVTLSENDQTKIKDYLQNGGRLFISGSEIGWDLYEKGNEVDRQFFNDYLKATFIGDGGAGRSPANGIVNTVFSDLVVEFGLTYPEDYPDEISANGGSATILEYTTLAKYGGVSFTGQFGDGIIPGALVYLSFPLESAAQVDIDETLAKVVEYFEVNTSTAPIAINDYTTTFLNMADSIDVLNNDWDNNNDIDPASITIIDQPTSGTANVSNQQVVYQPDVTFTGDDSFTYQVSDEGGLVSNVATVFVTVESVLAVEGGFSNQQMPEISLFPNPTGNGVTLEIVLNKIEPDPWTITIVDYNGKVVVQERKSLLYGKNELDLGAESLKPGLYMVLVTAKQMTTTLKLIKK